MPSVVSALCELLQCHDFELEDELKDENVRRRVESFLKTKRLFTNYKAKKAIVFKGITNKLNAATAMAYNGYLNITIQQHYYCRHRIKLEFPHLPLAVQYTHHMRSFFPLEVLDIHDDDKCGW